MDFAEKTLNEKLIFEGKIITVHVDDVELPDGSKSIREIVEHSGGVCVAALTEDKKLKFVRQFRYPYKKELLELPAGKLEKGEDPMAAGIRELEEECGVVAEKVISMGQIYPTVAYCSELSKAVEMVMNGEICDSKTVALILKTARIYGDK